MEEVIRYLEENFPEFAKKVKEEYERIKSVHQEKVEIAGKLSATPFKGSVDFSNGIMGLAERFVSNDKRIREIYEKAYEVLDSGQVSRIKKRYKDYTESVENMILKYGITNLITAAQATMSLNASNVNAMVEEVLGRKTIKDSIHQELRSLDFNFSDPEGLKLLIAKIETFPELKDDIFSVLYFIVEREKYFKSKGYEETKIYESVLSDEEREVLIQIFARRNGEELTKEGYLDVLDKEYEKFFEQIEKVHGIPYLVEHPSIPSDDIDWDKVSNYYHNIRNKRNGHIAFHVFGPMRGIKTTKKVGSVYVLKYERKKTSEVVFFDGNLKRIKPTSKKNDIELYFNGYYLVRHDKAKNEHAKSVYGLTDEELKFIVLDSNFNFICKINDSDFLIDRVRKTLLARDKQTGEYTLYDRNFKPFRKFKLPGTFISPRGIFNDGVVALEKKDYQIVYFDIETMSIIKSFEYANLASVFGYSEGMYNVVDRSIPDIYQEFYLTKDGQLAIPRHFYQTSPFASGCAYVHTDILVPGFIDRYGNFVNFDDMQVKYKPEEDMELKIFIDQEKGMYDIQNPEWVKEYTREKSYVHCDYHMYLGETKDKISRILEAIENNPSLSITSSQNTAGGSVKTNLPKEPK